MAISQIQSASLASGVPSSANMPAGSVLQVVQYVYTSSATTTSGTLVSSPLTVSITPKSASNKIYISISGTCGNGGTNGAGFAIYRNGSLIFNPSASDGATTQQYYWYSANGITFPFALAYLDSPATTSSTTYTLYFSSYSGATVTLNSSGNYQSGKSTITVMEVAA